MCLNVRFSRRFGKILTLKYPQNCYSYGHISHVGGVSSTLSKYLYIQTFCVNHTFSTLNFLSSILCSFSCLSRYVYLQVINFCTSILFIFRYVPTDWASKTELSLEEVSDLNAMNIELAGLLGKKNPAFTPFQHGNFSCIMIKEVRTFVYYFC